MGVALDSDVLAVALLWLDALPAWGGFFLVWECGLPEALLLPPAT